MVNVANKSADVKLGSISYSTFALILSLFVCITTAAIIFWNATLDDSSVVSDDSITYRSRALDECSSPMRPFFQAIETRDPASVNWLTIVSLGAFACSVSKGSADLLVLGGNIVVLTLTLLVYRKVIKSYVFPAKIRPWLIVLLALQPWLVLSIISLNKEVISYLAVAVMLYLYLSRSLKLLLITGILAGSIKIQFLVFALMLAASLRGVTLLRQLVITSLLVSIIYHFFDLPYFSAEEYFSHFGYEIRTEEIARKLTELASLPMGLILVYPARFLMNLMSGFSPMRIIEIDNIQSLFFQVNALLLSGWSAAFFLRLMSKKIAFDNLITQFIMLYGLMMSLLPFFQIRYFLPLLPPILIVVLGGRSAMLRTLRNTTSQTTSYAQSV